MKRKILSIALLVSVISSLSSCFVAHDRRDGHRRGHDRDDHHDYHYNQYNH